jgi:hypothetical protein
MRKHEVSGEIGVAKKVILEEAKTQPNETEALLQECLNKGIIYEPKKGFYRQTND